MASSGVNSNADEGGSPSTEQKNPFRSFFRAVSCNVCHKRSDVVQSGNLRAKVRVAGPSVKRDGDASDTEIGVLLIFVRSSHCCSRFRLLFFLQLCSVEVDIVDEFSVPSVLLYSPARCRCRLSSSQRPLPSGSSLIGGYCNVTSLTKTE